MVGMIKLVPGTLTVTDTLKLSQFSLVNRSLESRLPDVLRTVLIFQRGAMYHLANTYMPTISLLVLVITTLYLDESKLDIAVSLSLTVLLVIYTFYQSITTTVPKTSYLKLIDYWLMFVLLMPFTIFVIEIIVFFDATRGSQAPILLTRFLN